MNKKVKGIIAIAVLICTTLACGMAVSYSETVNRYKVTYSNQRAAGGLNMVVTGTSNQSLTTAVNTGVGTYVIESYVRGYNPKTKDVIDSDADAAVVTQGGAIYSSVSRDWDNVFYQYEHRAHRWSSSSLSNLSSANLVDSAEYIVTQNN